MQRILEFLTLVSLVLWPVTGVFPHGEERAWAGNDRRGDLRALGGVAEKAGSQMDPDGTSQSNASAGGGS